VENAGLGQKMLLLHGSPEASSKSGFWFQIKADASVEPQEYIGISRTQGERPTPIWGQKTFLS
jgi:hypothetical protein